MIMLRIGVWNKMSINQSMANYITLKIYIIKTKLSTKAYNVIISL